MSLSKNLQKWVAQKIITQEQADKIAELEQSAHTSWAWRAMFIIAGLFIGSGFILLIGANWDAIPPSIKLLGNFAIYAGILYITFQSIIKKEKNIQELFLTLSFLMVAATIGLIGQIFNLSGGWQSFSISWALLGIPFILLSRMLPLNIIWLILLFAGIDFDDIFTWLFREEKLLNLVLTTSALALISYAGQKMYEGINKIIILPKALAKLSLLAMYLITIIGGIILGFNTFAASIFIFVFLGIRMAIAFINKNPLSFRNNTLLFELFIFYLFVSRYGNLFASGIGFIFAGLLLLLLIYGLKKTASRIKQFNWSKFNEQ